MVVSDTMRARAKRDKVPDSKAPIPPEVVDASESSRADPRPVDQPPARQEAYVTVDALNNFMSTMTDAIIQQVSGQVKNAEEAASSTRPLPHFEYVPTGGCESSRRCNLAASPRRNERMQEAPHINKDRWSREENRDDSIKANPHPNYRPGHERLAKSTMTSTTYPTHS